VYHKQAYAIIYVFSYLRGAAGEFYDSGIKKIVHRMQKCIDLNGDYVEK
jgi:hypothetical protein